MHARGDPTVPFEEGRKVAALIPGTRFMPRETRNHILMDGEPAWTQFVEAVEDFLPSPKHGIGIVLYGRTPWLQRSTSLPRIPEGLENLSILEGLRPLADFRARCLCRD
jgi:hypothetical protein